MALLPDDPAELAAALRLAFIVGACITVAVFVWFVFFL